MNLDPAQKSVLDKAVPVFSEWYASVEVDQLPIKDLCLEAFIEGMKHVARMTQEIIER